MQNYCAEIKIWAERRAGELLREMEKHPGGRPTENPFQHARGFQSRLEDLGVSHAQSHRYQTIASLPDEDFEAHIAETEESWFIKRFVLCADAPG
jgi:hypothetical protein